MKKTLLIVCGLLLAQATQGAFAGENNISNPIRYLPKWESLDSRPTPKWFAEAKLGIFIHWGIYSVPSWGPKRHLVDTPGKAYAEWYWAAISINRNMEHGKLYYKHHVDTYGNKFQYQDFAPMFKAEMFDPDEWAELFAHSGARYVVLVAKHHDGFCLWPSAQSPNWNSVDIGPHRDLVGDISTAVRKQGLKMGFHYSLQEWFHPLMSLNLPQEQWQSEKYVNEHMIPQMKDLVDRYQPSLLFADGHWYLDVDWKSKEFLAWLYNDSSVRDKIAVNDRWEKITVGDKIIDSMGRHGGFYTTEYDEIWLSETETLAFNEKHPWVECRGIGSSFGYNRNEDISDYLSEPALIHLLVEKVSRGGGLLLNVSPTADGRIPVIMQERLLQLGEWLKVNGEAIYGSSSWSKRAEDNKKVRYTIKNDVVYAISLAWPGKELKLSEIPIQSNSKIELLGTDFQLPWSAEAEVITIDLSEVIPDKLPCKHAYTFKITNTGF